MMMRMIMKQLVYYGMGEGWCVLGRVFGHAETNCAHIASSGPPTALAATAHIG